MVSSGFDLFKIVFEKNARNCTFVKILVILKSLVQLGYKIDILTRNNLKNKLKVVHFLQLVTYFVKSGIPRLTN